MFFEDGPCPTQSQSSRMDLGHSVFIFLFSRVRSNWRVSTSTHLASSSNTLASSVLHPSLYLARLGVNVVGVPQDKPNPLCLGIAAQRLKSYQGSNLLAWLQHPFMDHEQIELLRKVVVLGVSKKEQRPNPKSSVFQSSIANSVFVLPISIHMLMLLGPYLPDNQ